MTKAYAALNAKSPLVPFEIARREPRARDVVIEILYCGVCHSDIHQARDEWGGSMFPMVPGHEIVGRVVKVGAQVKRFQEGELAAVGVMVDSCRECESCNKGLEQCCEKGFVGTYNAVEPDTGTPTYGGYSQTIVVDEAFVLSVPKNLDLAGTAPLLCAGITTYSPLRQWNVQKGMRVGIVGLGGLGHMGVKFSHALGAETVVFTTSESKREDALRLGAAEVVVTREPDAFEKAGKFDLILDTVSGEHDLNAYLNLLRTDGVMVLVGLPEKPIAISAFSLILGRHRLAGSIIGSVRETQEMLNFCGERGITSDVEVIRAERINEAYERMLRGDVKYRFVIDTKTI